MKIERKLFNWKFSNVLKIYNIGIVLGLLCQWKYLFNNYSPKSILCVCTVEFPSYTQARTHDLFENCCTKVPHSQNHMKYVNFPLWPTVNILKLENVYNAWPHWQPFVFHISDSMHIYSGINSSKTIQFAAHRYLWAHTQQQLLCSNSSADRMVILSSVDGHQTVCEWHQNNYKMLFV